eukprot:Sdes_comp9064_c0_seq1m501
MGAISAAPVGAGLKALIFASETWSAKPGRRKMRSANITSATLWLIEPTRVGFKTQFEGSCVVNGDIQEILTDYIFQSLGVSSENKVDHPIVCTEPVCNPNACRQLMNELYFELYEVPMITYGVDSLFSLYYNSGGHFSSGIVVSSGFQSTHVLPVWDARFDARRCKRMNVGGLHSTQMLTSLLELRYPAHRAALTSSKVEEMIHDYCFMSTDYPASLQHWTSDDYRMKHTCVIQLPFEKPDENSELLLKEREMRRKENIEKMRQFQLEKRIKLLREKEKELADLEAIRILGKEDKDDFLEALQSYGIQSKKHLEQTIEESMKAIKKLRNRIHGVVEEEPEEREEKEPAVFDLLNVPNSQLNEEQLKEKKRQRFMKNAAAGREKARKLRDQLRMEEEEARKKEDNFRIAHREEWLHQIYTRREDIVKRRMQRRRLKQELQNRRSHASKQRMRLIAQQAHEAADLNHSKSRKKKEDTFGLDDEDWSVYRVINKDEDDSASERDEDELRVLDQKLLEHDPKFRDEQIRGDEEPPLETFHQLHLSVERIRVPEILYQPYMIGVDQTGLTEMMNYVFRSFTLEQQAVLQNNIFFTGGNTCFPNFQERLEKEVCSILPFQSKFRVSAAKDPRLDPWKGASLFCRNQNFSKQCLTRADYEEKGSHYLLEHSCSNLY